MPPVVGFVGGLLTYTSAAAYGAALITYANVIGTTLLIASSVAYSATQQRKLKKSLDAMRAGASVIDQNRTMMIRDPVAHRCYIYGQVLVSGNIIFFHQAATNNYHYFVIALADRECEELGEIRVDNVVETFDGSGNATGNYAGFLQIRKFNGLAAGERDTTWESEISTKWTANHLGKNIARLHVRIVWDADKFPNGLPNITCLVKGAKVYDWRTGTTAYSANAALCTADWLMDTRLGKEVAQARIKAAEMQEAANVSDEVIVLADSVAAGSFVVGRVYEIEAVGTTDFTAIGAASNTVGVQFTATGAGTGTGTAHSTEKRYECNGVARAENDPNETFRDMLGAMAGHACDTGGLWTIRAGAWRTPEFTFTDSDIISSFRWVPRSSRQDTYNGVRGQYISPINDWAPADFPAVKNDTYMAKDGNRRQWKSIALNFTTSPSMAQRLAKIDLEVGRQAIVCSSEFMLKALQVQPGDVTSLTRDNLGWSGKYFEVDQWAFRLVDLDSNPRPVIPMTLRETAEGVWDWNDGEETTVDLAPNTDLSDPKTVATPSGLTLNSSSHTIIQPDGTVIPKIKVSWTAPTDQQILSGGHVEIEYRVNGSSTWLSWADNIDGSLTEDFITDVKAGVGYDVRIRFRNVAGVRGAYATVTNHVVAGDTTAPSAPGSVTATGKLEHIVVDWAANTEADLAGYEVWRNTTNNSGTATKVWEGKGNRFVDSLVAASTTYYYWIKAVDSSGNASGFSSGVNASRGEQSGGSGPTYTLQIQSQWNGTAYVAITVNGAAGTHLGSGLYEWTGLTAGDYATIAAPASDGAWTFTGWTGDSIVVDLIENTANNSTSILMAGNLAAVLS